MRYWGLFFVALATFLYLYLYLFLAGIGVVERGDPSLLAIVTASGMIGFICFAFDRTTLAVDDPDVARKPHTGLRYCPRCGEPVSRPGFRRGSVI